MRTDGRAQVEAREFDVIVTGGGVWPAAVVADHETGTLFMAEQASGPVTLPECHVRRTSHTYVVGPAAFPTIGSPDPVLTG